MAMPIIIFLLEFFAQLAHAEQSAVRTQPPVVEAHVPMPAGFAAPMTQAAARVTKKHYGTYITPESSPVFPERFRGYHTGVDFETFPDEQDVDVSVFAICDGPLLKKTWASGYGGVAVQSCTWRGGPMTVVYGHVRLSSVSADVGDALTMGERVAVLGTGFSKETDNRRKHLHLGIHKGPDVEYRGYVATADELAQWIDFEQVR